jgi:hypothetical protein
MPNCPFGTPVEGPTRSVIADQEIAGRFTGTLAQALHE